MAYDYSADVAFATEMVAEYGRLITLTKEVQEVDSADPLGAPVADPEEVAGIRAVFVYPSGLVNLGLSVRSRELMKESEQIAIIAADGTNAFDQFTGAIDSDGSVWAVNATEVFKPGDTTLLYYLGMKRP
jgi:hypothetical protein